MVQAQNDSKHFIFNIILRVNLYLYFAEKCGPLTYFNILKLSRSLPLVEYLSSEPDVFLLE